MRRILRLLLALPLLAPPLAHALGAEDLLEPEKAFRPTVQAIDPQTGRSEEHTSELQSHDLY